MGEGGNVGPACYASLHSIGGVRAEGGEAPLLLLLLVLVLLLRLLLLPFILSLRNMTRARTGQRCCC